MDEQANIGLVQQCYDAFMKGDIQRLLGYMTPDIAWDIPETEGATFSGRRQGVDAVADFFRDLGQSQTPLQFQPDDYICQGDRVVACGHYSWRVNATGEEFGSNWLHLFTIRSGKVCGFHEFVDNHSSVAAYQGQHAGAMQSTGAQTDATRSSIH
ncbi:nuclear transport factor 2 family protein [Oxalobacteraceae bacterium OM1]|nr:nuclear transport factor 2 family protein [Oxalobacteraceae bacterium OM1]